MQNKPTRQELCDRTAIFAAIELVVQRGQVTELRALDAITSADSWPKTISGYFDDIHQLATAASTIKSAKGIYFVPNPVAPALLSRAANRIRAVGKDPTTSDGDIVKRQWLLIDVDPDRPAGISSSDLEHDAAIAKASEIRAALAERG